MPIRWDEPHNDEGDQNGDTAISGHGFWSLGPNRGPDDWGVELIARDEHLEEIGGGVHVDPIPAVAAVHAVIPLLMVVTCGLFSWRPVPSRMRYVVLAYEVFLGFAIVTLSFRPLVVMASTVYPGWERWVFPFSVYLFTFTAAAALLTLGQANTNDEEFAPRSR